MLIFTFIYIYCNIYEHKKSFISFFDYQYFFYILYEFNFFVYMFRHKYFFKIFLPKFLGLKHIQIFL